MGSLTAHLPSPPHPGGGSLPPSPPSPATLPTWQRSGGRGSSTRPPYPRPPRNHRDSRGCAGEGRTRPPRKSCDGCRSPRRFAPCLVRSTSRNRLLLRGVVLVAPPLLTAFASSRALPQAELVPAEVPRALHL